MTKKLLLPKDACDELLRRYTNQHKTWLLGGGQWPMSLKLGAPTESDVAGDAQGVRRWVEAWVSWSSPGKVTWVSRQWGRLGTQQLPATLEFLGPENVASTIGQGRRWRTAGQRYKELTARWPQLAGQSGVGRYFSVLAEYSNADFVRLFAMLDWLERNPESGLAPRQLPVAGVDTKWLEKRTGLITDFLKSIRGNDVSGDFYLVCGLRRPATRIRMHILCPKLRKCVGGLKDIEVSVSELAQLSINPKAILIVENLETGLALPDMDGVVAFMRLGNAVSLLSELPWLRGCSVAYWGDIDTHGYAILNRARAIFPNLVSLLMDAKTLTSYSELWVEEPVQYSEPSLPLIDESENEVFVGLMSGKWGLRVRLEQERIPWVEAVEVVERQFVAAKVIKTEICSEFAEPKG
ncbi:MAG: DUF3322 and DUF2220 domain-containing protein [Rhodocyclaceae bacterium]|nr:DUF3322 and DUF2220 domain-containing protein [Rhodocyclaceae bacterium]